jgi:hypothetical protein
VQLPRVPLAAAAISNSMPGSGYVMLNTEHSAESAETAESRETERSTVSLC